MKIFAFVAVFVAALLLVNSADAAGRRAVVLYGSAGTAASPDAASAVRRAVGATELKSFESVVAARDALDLASRPFWALGADSQDGCVGDGLTLEQLEPYLRLAQSSVDEIEYEDARTVLSDVKAFLPCASDQVPAEFLYRVPFLEGQVAMWTGNLDKAKNFFRAAAVLDWSHPIDTTVAPEIQSFAATGLQEAAKTKARIAFGKVLASDEIFLNGKLVADASSATDILAGEQFVQVRSNGKMSGAWVKVGREAFVLSPVDVEHGLFNKRAEAVALLSKTARAKGWDEVILVSESEVARFDVNSGAYVAINPKAANANRDAGATMLFAGGAAAIGGFAIELGAYQHATKLLSDGPPIDPVAYERDLRLYGTGLAIGLGGSAVGAVGLVISIAAARHPAADKKLIIVPIPGGVGVSGQW